MKAGGGQYGAVNRGAEVIGKADVDFSHLSETEGAAKAFGFYLADDSINPVADSSGVLDKTTVLERMRKLDERGLVLSWGPSRAETAHSDDMGFTYGKWELRKKETGKTIGTLVGYGYYVTVWKKIDGQWKASFDMGNEATLEAK